MYPDAFHCRCTHLRCRSSRPKRTTEGTTDVRSPIRISLTAVHSILKYTVRELSCLDKCDVIFFWMRLRGWTRMRSFYTMRFWNKVSFKMVCVSDCGSLSKPAKLSCYETIYKRNLGVLLPRVSWPCYLYSFNLPDKGRCHFLLLLSIPFSLGPLIPAQVWR